MVDALLDGREQHNVELGLGQTVQGLELVWQQVLAANRLVGLGRKAVELEVDGGLYLGEAGEKALVPGDANAVGVQHHHLDALVLSQTEHRQDVGVDGGLAAAELHDLGLALQLDEAVQHPLHLGHGETEARLGHRRSRSDSPGCSSC